MVGGDETIQPIFVDVMRQQGSRGYAENCHGRREQTLSRCRLIK